MTDQPPRTVSDAMVTRPWTHGATTTVAQAREALADSHVHMLLLTDGDELRGTLVRDDLSPDLAPDRPALDVATLRGRTIGPEQDVEEALRTLRQHGARRLAVVADDGTLLGLLCLKRTLDGFCSDADVRSRALEHGRLHRIGR
jgi:CBS domain-containing protein